MRHRRVMLITCQAGFEPLLARELMESGATPNNQGPGWVLVDQAPAELAFAHLRLHETTEVKGESVNGLAQKLSEYYLQGIQGRRIDAPWPCIFDGPSELVGLGRRVNAVEKAVHELLRKRFSRVAKLAVAELPRGVSEANGLFVWFTDFGCAHVALRASVNGQKRMADDHLAPSRSYLKVEEAYIILGQAPVEGETVVDLGAAPGGWSYSAAKRGAQVIALDNGPMKGGALDHPRIEHRLEDAFHFLPTPGTTYDWLFCDLVEEPHHVVRHIIEPWLAGGWCRQFVVNLKFGRVDAVELLRELRAPGSPLLKYASGSRIRHLYHDREEFTITGRLVMTE